MASGCGAAVEWEPALHLSKPSERLDVSLQSVHRDGAEVRMRSGSRWTHSICVDCWNAKFPEKKTGPHSSGNVEVCCFCGLTHLSGIYLRMKPVTPGLLCRQGLMHA